MKYFFTMRADFKKNLRNELDYQDLTVKDLGARTAIPKATLDCYLGIRTSMPPADVAVRIASALGVTVEYLVTGTMCGPSGDFSNLPYAVSSARLLSTSLPSLSFPSLFPIASGLCARTPAIKRAMLRQTYRNFDETEPPSQNDA